MFFEKFLADADLDGDGMIDFYEFLKGMDKVNNPDQEEEEDV